MKRDRIKTLLLAEALICALLVLIAFAAACALFPHGWTAYWSTSAEALFPRLAWQWLIFALLAGWVVLRLLRRFSGGDTQELLKLFRALLILAAAYFVFEVCFAEFAGLFSAVDALKAGNTAFTVDTVLPVATDVTGSKSLVFSYVVLALRFAAEVLRCSPRRRRTSPSAFSTRWKTAHLRRRAPPTRQSSPNGVSRCSRSACCLRSRSTFCRRSVRRCS